MTRRPARWARSPLDYHAHLLLPESDHPSDVLKARCGAVMMTGVTQHDQPLSGLNCERCRLIFAEGTTISPRCPERVREAVRWSADGSQPSGYDVGAYGHPVPGGPAWHIGPCGDCDPSAELGRWRWTLRQICALASRAR